MKEKIFKNLSLKILSAVFAVVLWTVIVNVYDPTISYTFSNVSVQLINTDSLTDKNYSYEVVEGGKISVYVSGPKSIVTNIKASDIVATADLSKISAFADYVDIHVSVVKDGQVLNNVEASPKTSAVKLSIENRETKTLDVTSEITGTPANGYAVVKEVLNPVSIKLTGPSSIIDSVSKIGVQYDVTGATADITGTADIHLYNDDGEEITDPSVELTQSNVGYTIQIARIKTVNIEAESSGTPKEGYAVAGIELNQNHVNIYGPEDKLNAIDTIVIPSENINVDDLNSDKTFKFLLDNYIDKNLAILGNSRVEVTVKIKSVATRSLTLNTSDIRITGLESGMSYSFEKPTFDIEVGGVQEALDSLDVSQISMTADMSTYATEGTKDITVSVKLPDGITLGKPASVRIVLKNNNNETTAEKSESTSESTTASAFTNTTVR